MRTELFGLENRLFGLLVQGIYQPLCQSVIRDNMSNVTDKSTDKTAVMTFFIVSLPLFYLICYAYPANA